MPGDLADLVGNARRRDLRRGHVDQFGDPDARAKRADHRLGRVGGSIGVPPILIAQLAHPDQPQDVGNVAVAGTAAVDEHDVPVADDVVRRR